MILGEYPYPWILTETSIMEKKIRKNGEGECFFKKYVNARITFFEMPIVSENYVFQNACPLQTPKENF